MTPNPAPGDDGDRDQENPDIELPVPVNEPAWMDRMLNSGCARLPMTPEIFRTLYQNEWQPSCADDLTAYHSHLCPCPACADAEYRRNSNLLKHFQRTSQW